MLRSLHSSVFLCGLLLLSACKSTPEQPAAGTSAPVLSAPEKKDTPPEAPTPSAAVARVGEKAPLFSLTDLEGKTVQLSDYAGKRVVLEWFNPGCPYVQASHTKGSLKGYADQLKKKDVVLLAINSAAPGKQGHGKEVNQKAAQDLGIQYPILLDEDGQVGRLYGAERTPHLYLINEEGILVYAGAIDNSPDGEGKEPEGGKLIHYVEQALEEIQAGKAVSVPETKSYGCTVKYGS